MAGTRFAPDRGLTSRMLVTMFLLGLLYVVFMAVLVVVLGRRLWPFALVIAGVIFFIQYYFSDKIALYSMGGREVSPQEAPELHAIVDRLCALADMPKPRVAIADSDVPNAFATGRNQRVAVVCATTGILRRLTNEELEGVLSHELSHVAHRDVAVMTIASFLGVLAGMVTRLGLEFGLWGGFDSRRRDDREDNTGMMILIVVAASALVYAISFVLTRTLSRYRELSADRAGAVLTGKPSALASALVKVTGEMGRIPTKDLRQAEPFNAFYFTPALAKNSGGVAALFSTHPSLERRLEQLGRISAELGRG